MLTLAVISGSSLLDAIIWLVIAALIYFVLRWGIKEIGIPEPFNRIAVAITVLVVVVLLVNALLGLGGRPFLRW